VSILSAYSSCAHPYSVVLPTESVLPVRWVSLEVLQQGVYSHASDVWAYGVVLWEIFSCGKTPFGVFCMCADSRVRASLVLTTCWIFVPIGAALTNKQVIETVLSGNRLPPIAKCPQVFRNLMTACWSDAPKARPTIAELHSRVAAITNGLLQGSTDKGLGFIDAKHEVSVEGRECVWRAKRLKADGC
jgi:serine/threonine protein kinase